jgi:hypothetical protein
MNDCLLLNQNLFAVKREEEKKSGNLFSKNLISKYGK